MIVATSRIMVPTKHYHSLNRICNGNCTETTYYYIHKNRYSKKEKRRFIT